VSSHAGALEAIDRILNRGGDADDVLRQVVAVVHERLEGCRWVGISFVEGGELVLGPQLGERSGEETSVPISYEGTVVAELAVVADGLAAEDHALLERVALLISPHCLVGWDTGGEAWSP
jgi:hypothetical protein